MFAIRETTISGFMELQPAVRLDARGSFVKTFHQEFFEAHGLASQFCEHYYSVSNRGVLRGLHFQLPPHDQAKLVFCVAGEIFDVAVDLRIDSPTFGKHESMKISAARSNQAYLAKGLAHGFYVLSDSAIVVYNVTSMYAPAHDTGIHWASVGIQWPNVPPIISERDAAFPAFSEFHSPFRFAAVAS